MKTKMKTKLSTDVAAKIGSELKPGAPRDWNGSALTCRVDADMKSIVSASLATGLKPTRLLNMALREFFWRELAEIKRAGGRHE